MTVQGSASQASEATPQGRRKLSFGLGLGPEHRDTEVRVTSQVLKLTRDPAEVTVTGTVTAHLAPGRGGRGRVRRHLGR